MKEGRRNRKGKDSIRTGYLLSIESFVDCQLFSRPRDEGRFVSKLNNRLNRPNQR